MFEFLFFGNIFFLLKDKEINNIIIQLICF